MIRAIMHGRRKVQLFWSGIALVFALLASAAAAPEPMCGQVVFPTHAKIYQYMEKFFIAAVPLVPVKDPIFQVVFPAGTFFDPEAPSHGMRMEVSGCFDAVDENAVVSREQGTVTSRKGMFLGSIKTEKVCVVRLSVMDPLNFAVDLHTPRLTWGDLNTVNGNYYTQFSLQIIDSATGNVVQKSYSGNGADGYLRTENHIANISLSSIINGVPGYQGSAGSVDAIVIDADLPFPDPHQFYDFEPPFDNIADGHVPAKPGDPNYDAEHGAGDLPSYPDSVDAKIPVRPLHYKMTKSQNRIDLEFTAPVYVAGATYLMDVSGCIDYTGGLFHALTDKFGYAKVGNDLIRQGHCTFTLRRPAGGAASLTVPSSNDLGLNVYIMHDHGVSRWDHTHDANPAVPLYFGSAGRLSTIAFKNFAVSIQPAVFRPRDTVTEITVVGIPRNLPGAASIIQVQTRGIIYSGFASGAANTDFRMDVSGCGASLTNIAATSVCTSGSCTISLPASAAFVLTGSSCKVTVTPKIAATVYAGSGQIEIDFGTTTTTSATTLASSADNLSRFFIPSYTLMNAALEYAPQENGVQLQSLILRGTTTNQVATSSNPSIRVTLPRSLGLVAGTQYNFAVTGCATYGPTAQSIPGVTNEYIPCDVDITLALPGPIAEAVECVVTIQPTAGAMLRIPTQLNMTLQPTFTTLSNGEILDQADPAATTVKVVAPPLVVAPVAGNSSSGETGPDPGVSGSTTSSGTPEVHAWGLFVGIIAICAAVLFT